MYYTSKEFKEKAITRLQEKFKKIKKPMLFIVGIHETKASKSFISKKVELAASLGVNAIVYSIGEKTEQESLSEFRLLVNVLDGPIILQLPLFHNQ